MIELVLVRHGETEGQSSIRLYGATDIPLSDRGRRQMQKVAIAIDGERFARVVVSPLVRSREGAEIALNGKATGSHPSSVPPSPDPPTVPPPINLPIKVIPALREIDFGSWEGWTFAEAGERDPEAHAAWLRTRGGDFRFPGGESRLGFERRVSEVVPDVFDPARGATLAVLHKGVIKVILGTLLGLPAPEYRHLPVHLGSIHRLRFEEGRWASGTRNEIGHLGEEWIPDPPPTRDVSPSDKTS